MITCAVLFALTCNVNGAFAKAESNDLTELFDLLDQYDSMLYLSQYNLDSFC
jgi:hypothetical protein